MTELNDELLKGKGGYQAKISDSSFSDIPENNINVVGGYLQLMVSIITPKKEISIIKILKNARLILSDDYIKKNDNLWKEHVAASLRETMDGHFEGNMQKVLRHLPKREDGGDPTKFYIEMQEVKDFLNNLAHMKYDDVSKYVKNKFNLTEPELTEQTFNRICKNLVDDLYGWFSQYCYKE